MQGKTVYGFKILEVCRENNITMVKVVCPICGKIYTIRADYLKYRKSCGCLTKPYEIEKGKKIAEEAKKQCIDGTSIRSLTTKISKANKSGIKGVHWDKKRNKWAAQITFKGKNHYLGRYDNKEDAREAREKAEKEMFGKFLEEHKEYVKDRKGDMSHEKRILGKSKVGKNSGYEKI